MASSSASRQAFRIGLTVAAAAIVGVVFWHSPLLYPLKLLTVVFHEAGHALATYAVGGSVDAISINAYQGGVTHCRIPDSWWRRVVVSSAGYLGSTFFGAGLLLLSARDRPAWFPRAVLGGIGVGLGLLALFFFRDLFSWAFALPTAAVLVLAGRFLSPEAARPPALFLATFTCLYALFDLRDDVLRLPWEVRTDAVTDADALAAILPLPALFWALLWTGIALVTLTWALRRVIAIKSLDTLIPGR